MTSTSAYPMAPPARGGLPKWVIPLGIAAGVLLLVVVPLISSRNRLVNKDEAVNQQFGQIDVGLQRRFDLIPNLAIAAKAVLKQEQDVFGEIARARTQYGGAKTEDEKVAASNSLDSALSRLLVIVESYPQLKSDQTIRDLMTQIEGSENRIAQERRTYNEIVTDYNRSIRRFPTSIVAGATGFSRRQLFIATPGSSQAPKVDLGTNPAPSPSAS